MANAPVADRRLRLHEETVRGLQAEPKHLPTAWLYDERGSRLYAEITRLPAYYLPRRERELLRSYAPDIAARAQAETLVELGAGSATNTRVLLDALVYVGTLERFVPLDLNEEVLRESAPAIAAAYPGIAVEPLVGDFLDELAWLPAAGRRLVAFLGSTIGNLYPLQRRAFLRALAGVLGDGGAFVVGVDLVKDPRRLQAAYNDRGGVTEAFVRNALTAVNAELDATFEQRRFDFDARWDPAHDWMDIGLRARQAHTVSIPGLELEVSFEAGEQLRVEVSTKFRREAFDREFGLAGLRLDSWWTDPAGDFALVLALPAVP
jgi:L-histidine N-alpha-methyltransferase